MNQDIFITSIHVKKVRNLENFDIPLSEEKRQHLIITGKNGSGKTSLLLEIDKFLRQILSRGFRNYQSLVNHLNAYSQKMQTTQELNERLKLEDAINSFNCEISRFGETAISFKNLDFVDMGEFKQKEPKFHEILKVEFFKNRSCFRVPRLSEIPYVGIKFDINLNLWLIL